MVSSNGDLLVAEQSMIKDQITRKYFIDKQVAVINDVNQGSYNSGYITFNFTLNNQELKPFFEEAIIAIPRVAGIACSTDVDISTNAGLNPFSLIPKMSLNGITSRNVKYNNVVLHDAQNNLNFFNCFKALTSYSADEVQKWGHETFMVKDSAGSQLLSANSATAPTAGVAALGGDGLTNNRTLPASGTGTAVDYNTLTDSSNVGLYERGKNIQGIALGGTTAILNAFSSVSNVANSGQWYATGAVGASGSAKRTGIWQWIDIIRVKDLIPALSNMELSNGGNFYIQLAFNSGSWTILVDNTTIPLMSMASSSLNSQSNASNVIFSAGSPNSANVNALALVGIKNSTLTIESNVSKLTTSLFAANTNPFFNSARMYIPMYKAKIPQEITPRTKIVCYEEIYSFQNLNVSAGSSFNYQILNNISNVKYVVIMPQIAQATPLMLVSACGSDYKNLFSSGPITTPPIAISPFNVALNGINVLENSLQYDDEVYTQEFNKINSINGGISHECSGLINRKDWTQAYRYYLVFCGRKSSNVPMSCAVSGKNTSTIACDLFGFIVYEKYYELDTQTGDIKIVAM